MDEKLEKHQCETFGKTKWNQLTWLFGMKLHFNCLFFAKCTFFFSEKMVTFITSKVASGTWMVDLVLVIFLNLARRFRRTCAFFFTFFQVLKKLCKNTQVVAFFHFFEENTQQIVKNLDYCVSFGMKKKTLCLPCGFFQNHRSDRAPDTKTTESWGH